MRNIYHTAYTLFDILYTWNIIYMANVLFNEIVHIYHSQCDEWFEAKKGCHADHSMYILYLYSYS